MVDLQTDRQTDRRQQSVLPLFLRLPGASPAPGACAGGGTRNLECISLGRFFSSLRFGLATIGAGIPCDDFKSAKFIRP